MIELDPEQRQAIAQGQPVQIVDPLTHDAYILVRAEDYARERRGEPRKSPIPGSRRWSFARSAHSGETCRVCS